MEVFFGWQRACASGQLAVSSWQLAINLKKLKNK
jgi:hypothetical protein